MNEEIEKEFEELYEAYKNIDLPTVTPIEDLIGNHDPENDLATFFEDEDDDEGYGHYTTYVDPDSDVMEVPNPRFHSDVWEVEIPPEVIEEIQEQFIASKTRSAMIDIEKYVWCQQWSNIRHKEIDPLMSAADYYLLFGIVNDAFVEYEPVYIPTFTELQVAGRKLRKSFKEIEQRQKDLEAKAEGDPRSFLTNLKDQANKKFHDLVEDLDLSFREYVHVACGGELRHHSSVQGILSAYRKGSWVHWKYVFEKYGVDAIDKMAEMFLEFPDTAYGGPAWSDAAMILAQRERGELGPDSFTNKQLFVDRVFTLEHNGGCFLNKLDWANLRSNREHPYDYHFEAMNETVLELHCAEVLNIDSMIGYASDHVANLVQRYLDLARENNYPINGIWKGIEPNTKDPVVTPSILDHKPQLELDWSPELNTLKVNKDVYEKLKESFKSKVPSITNHGSIGDLWGTQVIVDELIGDDLWISSSGYSEI